MWWCQQEGNEPSRWLATCSRSDPRVRKARWGRKKQPPLPMLEGRETCASQSRLSHSLPPKKLAVWQGKPYNAAVGRPQASQDTQEARLATPRRACDKQRLARLDKQVKLVK